MNRKQSIVVLAIIMIMTSIFVFGCKPTEPISSIWSGSFISDDENKVIYANYVYVNEGWTYKMIHDYVLWETKPLSLNLAMVISENYVPKEKFKNITTYEDFNELICPNDKNCKTIARVMKSCSDKKIPGYNHSLGNEVTTYIAMSGTSKLIDVYTIEEGPLPCEDLKDIANFIPQSD